MFKQRKKHLMGVALALALGAAGVVAGTEAAMRKDAFEAAQDRIEAQAKAQRQACGRLQGNAKDVCQVQAAGWQKVAKAQLEGSTSRARRRRRSSSSRAPMPTTPWPNNAARC